jgi:hypothetical protein
MDLETREAITAPTGKWRRFGHDIGSVLAVDAALGNIAPTVCGKTPRAPLNPGAKQAVETPPVVCLALDDVVTYQAARGGTVGLCVQDVNINLQLKQGRAGHAQCGIRAL